MREPRSTGARLEFFRRRSAELGLACTHQRQVIYRALAGSGAHPTPEAVYEQVRREVPSISLATVYKNIKVFLDAGLIREVSLLHQSQRLDANLAPHHHLVCVRCKTVEDLEQDRLAPVCWKRRLPRGFRPERYNVEVLGRCAACARGRSKENSWQT